MLPGSDLSSSPVHFEVTPVNISCCNHKSRATCYHSGDLLKHVIFVGLFYGASLSFYRWLWFYFFDNLQAVSCLSGLTLQKCPDDLLLAALEFLASMGKVFVPPNIQVQVSSF